MIESFGTPRVDAADLLALRDRSLFDTDTDDNDAIGSNDVQRWSGSRPERAIAAGPPRHDQTTVPFGVCQAAGRTARIGAAITMANNRNRRTFLAGQHATAIDRLRLPIAGLSSNMVSVSEQSTVQTNPDTIRCVVSGDRTRTAIALEKDRTYARTRCL